MEDFSLDMRTLNFIMILFSVIYCIGLLLFQIAQKPIEGLTLFSFSIFLIGSGPFLLSFRGIIPDYLSIVSSNMLIVLGFHLTLYSLSIFRGYSTRFSQLSSILLLVVLACFIYFTYYDPSIRIRIVTISLFLAFVTLSTAFVTIKGKNEDLPLAVRMMALPFVAYSVFMAVRAVLAINEAEIADFMQAKLVHQLTFLFSIVLIVAMSFSMLWLINARLLRANEHLLHQDPLTKLQNRRALNDTIWHFQHKAQYAPVSIIMSDVDNFKSINDQYGHLVGDDVIQIVANTTQHKLSDSAAAFRLGGDEIMILIPSCTLIEAEVWANQLRQTLSGVTLATQPELQLTVSFGIALLSPTKNWQESVEKADKALYQSKRNGRNTVSIVA
ncbi:GGDEF domain-containing protein [Vibrio sp. ZSDE26]|uniref:diguanylate cyclase n=1 Tax=Vibrio amylolyticus TaxID=2847292 RepID=A0A9X1XJZ3_9VIBR|nr:GGDEF domain-containing protein [Vibrio amylolyticus]MCK6264657.1 GGDEF domain-containing protein [Vibrio amylolyticus]